jgi:hypothetical protein
MTCLDILVSWSGAPRPIVIAWEIMARKWKNLGADG